MSKLLAIRSALSYHNYKWPKELWTGVMFYEGYKITIEEFEKALQEENAELKAQLKIAIEALNEIKFAALQGDETFSEINCYHLASDCLLTLKTTEE